MVGPLLAVCALLTSSSSFQFFLRLMAAISARARREARPSSSATILSASSTWTRYLSTSWGRAAATCSRDSRNLPTSTFLLSFSFKTTYKEATMFKMRFYLHFTVSITSSDLSEDILFLMCVSSSCFLAARGQSGLGSAPWSCSSAVLQWGGVASCSSASSGSHANTPFRHWTTSLVCWPSLPGRHVGD